MSNAHFAIKHFRNYSPIPAYPSLKEAVQAFIKAQEAGGMTDSDLFSLGDAIYVISGTYKGKRYWNVNWFNQGKIFFEPDFDAEGGATWKDFKECAEYEEPCWNPADDEWLIVDGDWDGKKED